ncbi:MAG: hypothetical protein PUF20_10700 [Clostridiales bacterium]|nr:hypothetical protein [Clostridiales bacterium]
MPTNEELLKQLYKQQTQSQQNQQNPAAATSTDSAPASSAAAPAAGAAQGNTPQAPANGESTAPAADATGTGSTGLTGESSGKSLWDRYRESLSSLGDYKTPTANSQEELIRKMYESNLDSYKSQLESDYNQNLSDLGAEESKLGQIYYEQQRQAQAESDRNRQAFQEYANARGLNSGTGGQAELAQSNQLSANLNALRQSEAEKRAEVERQRQLLGQQYQKAIQKAQADNDLNLAKALYEEAVRVDESINSAAQADADRALQIFNMLNNTALSAAGAYASKSGDLSLYEKLLAGDSTSELEDLYNKAQQIVSSGGYYSGGGGGSGSGYKRATSDEMEWAQYYIDMIRNAGGVDNVQDYLATNYKEYGIPYQTVSKTTASMAEKAKGYSTNEYQIGSEKGRDIANSLGVGNTYRASDNSVWRKSSNGNIYVTKDGVTMKANIV